MHGGRRDCCSIAVKRTGRQLVHLRSDTVVLQTLLPAGARIFIQSLCVPASDRSFATSVLRRNATRREPIHLVADNIYFLTPSLQARDHGFGFLGEAR
jgi:hypothetical protein